MASITGLVLDERFQQHDTGPMHPERPERLKAITAALEGAGLVEACTRVGPRPVERRWLQSNHDDAYIDRLQRACASGQRHIDCADSAISGESFEIAELAAGAVVAATVAVARGELANAFCAVRPPGHHAEQDRSMGFCMFNNVAIAARVLLAEHGVERVFILDWDVHHGNGTQHSFESDPRVFFCSLHGHPDTLYPGTGYAHERGLGPGEGATLNIPMMPGSGDDDYRRAFEEQIAPAVADYKPEFILVSAGFDAHRRDPLAHIQLETSSYAWMTHEVLAWADQHCRGRLVSMLEGGYDLQALGESAAVHLDGLVQASGPGRPPQA